MATGLCSSGATLQVTIADISTRAATSHAPNGHNYAASATATASGGNGDDIDRGDSSDIMMYCEPKIYLHLSWYETPEATGFPLRNRHPDP